MDADIAAQRYTDLVIQLVDSNDGVTDLDGVLLVHGRPFAQLREGSLAVRLPATRIRDLATRRIAEEHIDDWVLIADQSLWAEMAREAHEFVGEPPIGRQS